MKLTRRVDLNVGYSCNERCIFCYYQQTVVGRDDRKYQIKDLSTEDCLERIRWIGKQGIETLELTGGEPTIRDDLFEIVDFARQQGFVSVSVITNGLRCSAPDYARRLVDAGVDDVLISLHGCEAATHDRVTGIAHSFDRAVRAAENLVGHGVRVRANCVVTGLNYQSAPETLALFGRLGLEVGNFILFNPIEEADWRSAPELNVRYSDAAPYLKRAIEEHASKLQRVVVRYIPFCLMRGYEQHVVNMLQIPYDPDEWDYVVRMKMRRGAPAAAAAVAVGMLVHPSCSGALRRAGWRGLTREAIKYALVLKNKRYGEQCFGCAYLPICDGLWRKYVEWAGFDEFKPVAGARLIDPTRLLKIP